MAVQNETDYTAPCEARLGDCRASNHYVVTVNEGYEVRRSGWLSSVNDLEPIIELTDYTGYVRNCVLTPDQRERLRRYPGVAKLVQFDDEDWLRLRKPRVLADERRGFVGNQGYIVYLADREVYTVQQHFARIGREVKHSVLPWNGYFAKEDLYAKEIEDIFSDPTFRGSLENCSIRR